MDKKILITGATGYLGNFLAEYFGKKGFQVVGIDIGDQPVKHIPNYKLIKCDVRDKAKMQEIFTKEKPTNVIHLAYLMDPLHDKKAEYEIDVVGSQNLLEVVNQTASVKQLIHFSSASIYGAHPDNKDWLKEQDELRPADYTYAIYKKLLEKWYDDFDKRDDLNLFTFRMCTAVGPSYYKPGGVVNSFIKAPISLLVGKNEFKAQFIHEDDVKALTEMVVNDPEIEGIYNLAPDSYATMRDLAKTYKKRAIRVPVWLLKGIFWILWNLRIARLTPAMAKLMAYSIVIDPHKLMKKFNYKYKYTTEEAFMDAAVKRGLWKVPR
ncbi:NAD-dependent epimerase/dehydratase family protein [Patescibacteria group bacterium]|nr:NAD-dependent epimerase/dehydratase family protein [Patescibacteria group bacterium]